MYHVEFPKFGWEFDLSPTVFKIGNFELRWYGLIIACGFLLAFIYALYSAKKMRINQDKLINCVIFGLIGALGALALKYRALSAHACIMLSFIRVLRIEIIPWQSSIFSKADWESMVVLSALC